MSEFKVGDTVRFENFDAKVKKISANHPTDIGWAGPWLHIKKTNGFKFLHADDVYLVKEQELSNPKVEQGESELAFPQIRREEQFVIYLDKEDDIVFTRAEAEQLYRKLGELLC